MLTGRVFIFIAAQLLSIFPFPPPAFQLSSYKPPLKHHNHRAIPPFLPKKKKNPRKIIDSPKKTPPSYPHPQTASPHDPPTQTSPQPSASLPPSPPPQFSPSPPVSSHTRNKSAWLRLWRGREPRRGRRKAIYFFSPKRGVKSVSQSVSHDRVQEVWERNLKKLMSEEEEKKGTNTGDFPRLGLFDGLVETGAGV